jgi:segregation and condensation protein A
VARFLAVLELYREGAVAFEQVAPLAELHVRWTGTDEAAIDVGAEFDEDLETATTEIAEAAEASETAAPAVARLRLAPSLPKSTAASEELE